MSKLAVRYSKTISEDKQLLRWQMADSPSVILRTGQIEKLAACGKRHELLEKMLRYVSKGTKHFADVEEVGPVNIEKCKMTVIYHIQE